MKKSLIALAVISATGSAFAQSSVSIYGVVDTGYRSVTSGVNKFSGQANGSNSSNRLGFKGSEKLDNGITANFVMEGDLAPNDGTAAGFRFLRQSWVGASGSFGEVRLGRDYTPSFRHQLVVDPFGYVGVGSTANITSTVEIVPSIGAQAASNAAGTFVTANRGNIATTAPAAVSLAALPASYTFASPTTVRANNTFAYYSPDLNGFTAVGMYSAGAQNTNTERDLGRMMSLSLKYAQGPLTLGLVNEETKGGNAGALSTPAGVTIRPVGSSNTSCTGGTSLVASPQTAGDYYCLASATAGVAASDNQKWTTTLAVASYDLGVAKLNLGYRSDKASNVADFGKANSMIYSATAPVMGNVTLKAMFIDKKVDGAKAATQTSLGVVYDLSKRTALYATYANLKNEAGFGSVLGGSAVASKGGISSTGYDIGIRHNF